MIINFMVQLFFFLLALLGILAVCWIGILAIHEIVDAWRDLKKSLFK